MEDERKIKGGHAQAVKAGGMRIVQHKNTSGDKDKNVAAIDEANLALKISTSPPKQVVLPLHAKDYPKNHEKPMPSHDIREHFCPKSNIHQPR